MRNSIKRISFFFITILLFACTSAKVQDHSIIKPAIQEPVTISVLKKSQIFNNVITVKSEVSARAFKSDETIGNFSGVFTYSKPDKVNMRFFGPMGLNVMQISVSERLFQIFIPPKNTIYEWKTQMGFNSLLNDSFSYSMEESDDTYILNVFDKRELPVELISRYLFDKNSLHNKSILFYKNNKQFIKITFKDFVNNLPGVIKILFAAESGIEMTMKNPIVNQEIPNEYFKPIDHLGKEVKTIKDLFKKSDNLSQ